MSDEGVVTMRLMGTLAVVPVALVLLAAMARMRVG
jgi:hypothetical protein